MVTKLSFHTPRELEGHGSIVRFTPSSPRLIIRVVRVPRGLIARFTRVLYPINPTQLPSLSVFCVGREGVHFIRKIM